MAGSSSGTDGSVGLVRAVSAELKERKAYLAVFRKNAVFSFEGCVRIRVLAGLLEVEGHVIRPSYSFIDYYSLSVSGLSVLVSFNPQEATDKEFCQYTDPPLLTPLSLYSTREVGSSGGRKRKIDLDLDWADIQQLNAVINVKKWSHDVAAIAVFEELKNTLVTTLACSKQIPLLFPRVHSSSFLIPHFKPANSVEGGSKVNLPPVFRKIARDIMQDITKETKAVVLVCGPKNTGKSTLCRFMTNYMLNKFAEVCYLDTDVGQPEYTVPGVISLHRLHQHTHGPSFTHIRIPERAYYFGDVSPKPHPSFYVNLVQHCMDYYTGTILSDGPDQTPNPLIVNTCGWVNDIGYPLFLDVVRTVKPTHVIQLRHNDSTQIGEVPWLTQSILNSASGWSLQAQDPTPPQQLVKDVELFSQVITGRAKKVMVPSSPILISSEVEEGEKVEMETESMVISLLSSDSESEEEGPPSEKKQRLEDGPCKDEDEMEKADDNHEWFSGEHCTICSLVTHRAGILAQPKNALLHRRLSYLSYFSPLVESISLPTRKDIENFILASSPYCVPWSKLAVHCLHRKVPPSQMLYVLNANLVALVIVPDEELIDHSNQFPDIPKFIKSPQPVAEFVGLGLVRGIDPQRKLFFITTPLSTEALSRVNCLLAGNTIPPHLLVPQEHISMWCPYLLPDFKHTNTGNIGYR